MTNSEKFWRNGSRARLLATASSIALVAALYGTNSAIAAGNSGEPAIWLELGWQAEHVYNSQDNFSLPIGTYLPGFGLTDPISDLLKLSHSYGDDGKLTFRPDRSDWVFSASVRYGRSHAVSHFKREQPVTETKFAAYHTSIPYISKHLTNFAPQVGTSTSADIISAEKHFVLDFHAGRDVGLGVLGSGGTSVVSVGVRYAQLNTARGIADFNATGDTHFSSYQSAYRTWVYAHGTYHRVHKTRTTRREWWHQLSGTFKGSYNFTGIGPSVSWDASAALLGNKQHRGELELDWGVNGALLFGRQKNKVHHQTTGRYGCIGYQCYIFTQFGGHDHLYKSSGEAGTSKHVVVPNLGGFMGVSYRLLDFKASIGYRADFFLHAINTGFGDGHTITRGFQGPYASISIGIGD